MEFIDQLIDYPINCASEESDQTVHTLRWAYVRRYVLSHIDAFLADIQSTLVISSSKGLSELSRYPFVCVEVLRPSQPNGIMSSAVSLPNHTFTGQA